MNYYLFIEIASSILLLKYRPSFLKPYGFDSPIQEVSFVTRLECADGVSIATIDRAETSLKDQQVILNGIELC